MIAFFTRHPTAANLLMIAFIVLGVAALPNLLRETFPRISPKRVQISTCSSPMCRPRWKPSTTFLTRSKNR